MTDEQEILKLALELAEWKDRAEKAEARIAELEAHVAALQEKFDAEASCGCSYDDTDDVCMGHSPKLAAAEARVVKAEAERDEALSENQHWHDLGVFTGPTGHEEAWKARAEKAEAALERRQADIDHLDKRLADALDEIAALKEGQ